GAVWCGWCDLMEHESYSWPQLARFINANFIPGEGRLRCAAAVSGGARTSASSFEPAFRLALTGFVKPDGKLYFGGSYFPHEAKGDKPAFEDVLKKALRLYREHRPQIEREGVSVRRET